MDNFENTPDENEQEQIEKLIIEIQELKDKLAKMKNNSPEMQGIIMATST